MREKPGYIARANIRDPSVRYLWDDWNVEECVGPVDDEICDRLSGLSLRAAFAVLVGAAEWIVYRFEVLCDDALPFDAIDAAWAQVIDRLYAWPRNPFGRDEWSGPVRGPIQLTVGLMQDYANLLGELAEIAFGAAKVLKLADHVVPDKKAFSGWHDTVIERLEKLFPRINDDPLGDPVPREALNPDYNFDPAQTEFLLNRYLAQLDFEGNAFLLPPDLMRDYGFEETPYKFNLQEDRKRRQKR